ncbi:unnamed protein product [Pleuronectes platessa]|uniref:Uncharacterized protein n=1 Tax=Pleuronectes platessa TaxID=8262 RepID=A0A9N7YBT6_PLEPL|nr:unnamed protein product [Pleuronectes platessa]
MAASIIVQGDESPKQFVFTARGDGRDQQAPLCVRPKIFLVAEAKWNVVCLGRRPSLPLGLWPRSQPYVLLFASISRAAWKCFQRREGRERLEGRGREIVRQVKGGRRSPVDELSTRGRLQLVPYLVAGALSTPVSLSSVAEEMASNYSRGGY